MVCAGSGVAAIRASKSELHASAGAELGHGHTAILSQCRVSRAVLDLVEIRIFSLGMCQKTCLWSQECLKTLPHAFRTG